MNQGNLPFVSEDDLCEDAPVAASNSVKPQQRYGKAPKYPGQQSFYSNGLQEMPIQKSNKRSRRHELSMDNGEQRNDSSISQAESQIYHGVIMNELIDVSKSSPVEQGHSPAKDGDFDSSFVNEDRNEDRNAPYLLKDPCTRSISEQQLIEEVEGIHSGLTVFRKECLEFRARQEAASNKRSVDQKWAALLASLRTLIQKHDNIFPPAKGRRQRRWRLRAGVGFPQQTSFHP